MLWARGSRPAGAQRNGLATRQTPNELRHISRPGVVVRQGAARERLHLQPTYYTVMHLGKRGRVNVGKNRNAAKTALRKHANEADAGRSS